MTYRSPAVVWDESDYTPSECTRDGWRAGFSEIPQCSSRPPPRSDSDGTQLRRHLDEDDEQPADERITLGEIEAQS